MTNDPNPQKRDDNAERSSRGADYNPNEKPNADTNSNTQAQQKKDGWQGNSEAEPRDKNKAGNPFSQEPIYANTDEAQAPEGREITNRK